MAFAGFSQGVRGGGVDCMSGAILGLGGAEFPSSRVGNL